MEPTQAPSRKHSRFGMSRAAIYTICKAMPLFVERLPPQPETEEMREGTCAHVGLQMCIDNGYDPECLVSRRLEIRPGVRHEFTIEMANCILPLVAVARQHIAAGARVWVEHKFSLAEYDAELWGTADLVAYYADTGTLYVYDLKYGAGVYVEVEGNKQGGGYALGAMSAIDGPVHKVVVGIHQPRREDAEGRALRTWETTPAELVELGIELAASAQLARQPDATFTPGGHCQFCPGRGACDALHSTALAAAGADYEPNSGSFMPPVEYETLSPAELGRRKAQAAILRIWLNGLEQFADAEARRGNVAVGWKLARTLGNRAWRDGDLAMRQAQREFVGDVVEDELWERKALSPAKLEKLLGKARVSTFVEAYTMRPEGLALVTVDDPRPAYSSADDEFAPIEIPQ